jgi:hypothetical protein
MKLENNLFQKSYLYFIAFFLLVLTGFWFTYFSKLFEQENYRMHAHGIALILWCLMLIAQAFLIRIKKNALHRFIGKFSYLLVPVILFTTLDLLRYQLHKKTVLGTMDFFFVALVVNALVAFVIFFGLAIFYRRKSTLHARYMICTIFPMITPATDRIVHIYFPPLLPFLPSIEGNPIAPVVGFFIGDLLMLGLSIWDWRSHRRWNIFPFALAVLLIYHYSVLNFYKFEFWQAFSRYFFGS